MFIVLQRLRNPLGVSTVGKTHRLGAGIRSARVIEWHARGVHPWDRDLPAGQAAERFAQQCFEDVDAAIGRLFSALPQVDEIGLKVIHTATGEPIMQGTVTRQDAGHTKAASVRMKLTFIGISYRLSGSHLEVPPESGVTGTQVTRVMSPKNSLRLLKTRAAERSNVCRLNRPRRQRERR
jgi:hypothetical protein